MSRLGAVLVISALLVVATACGQAAGSGGPGGPGGGGPGGGGGWPTGREFRSTAVTEAGKDRPLVAGTRIDLGFPEDGRLGAQAGCNMLGGSGRIDAGRLVLGDLSMTEMGCDEPRHSQDTWLADFLGSDPTWSLTGAELVLRSGDLEIRLTDRKVTDPDRALVGTRWVVDTIITGDVASSVPAGVVAFIRLDSETSFTGSSGCASLGGTIQVRGDKILFPAVLPSPRNCSGAQAVMDNAMISTLLGEVAYRIDSDALTLTGPGGRGLVLRAS